jgi:hypothetical protein
MSEAVARGQRDVYFSLDGTWMGAVKGRVLHVVSFFFPQFADSIVVSTMKQMQGEH